MHAAAFSQVVSPTPAAQGQPETSSPDAAQSSASSDIVVTGSRISRRDYSSASPISTVSLEAIKSTGEVTLEKSLMTLPQFGIGENSTQTGFGSTGQATLNLRGLGAFRNLVLLDGRRMQPSNVQQAVDINTIPKSLIESVEVITGGASAVYGSDAIAGVVNFRTRKNFQGLMLDGQSNITGHGDGKVVDVAGTLGSNFADGRGNAVISMSYSKRNPVGFQSRAFYRENRGGTDLRIPTGAYTVGSNAPSQAAINALFSSYGVAAGSVSRNAALSFNADGTLFSASNGVFNYKGSQGGLLFNTGTQVNNLNVYLTLQAPLERYTAFGRTTYELTPDITAFGQFQYANYSTQVVVESGNTALSIPVTNPFIPAALSTLLASRANPTANLTLQKRFLEAGPRLTNRDFEVVQLVGGLQGKLTGIDGSWEVYGSHGSTSIDENQPGSVLISSLKALLNAADGGKSICAGGYNPFGVTTLSSACQSYLVASPYRKTTLKQDVIEANIQGGLLTLPGGQLRFAAGADYRRNSYATNVDRILQQADVVGVLFTSDSSGSTSVKEIYGELLVPIMKDMPFVHSLDLDLGYRYSDYNLSGGVHTYKADVTWAPVPMLLFRGGYARAVRAPSVGELFVPNNGAIPNIGEASNGLGDPCTLGSPARFGSNASAVRSLCIAQGVPAAVVDTFVNTQNETNATNSGNLALKPETADTFTAGVVISPKLEAPWFSRLNFTVDYYNIKVTNAIGVVAAGQSLASCFNYNGSNPTYSSTNFFCKNVTRDADGRLLNVFQPTLNLGAYKTAGVDFQLDWSIALDAIGLSPSSYLDLNSSVSWLDKFDVQTAAGGVFAHYAGTVGSTANGQPGSLPKWKAATSLSYRNEAATLGLRWRYLGAMQSASRATNPASTTPGQSPYNLFDLYASINVLKDYAFRFGVNNLFDRDPPRLGGQFGVTEASTYDVLGRTFYVGVNVKF
ncbi:TonB-dependent receptor domain-containing protein [Sphingomonas sp. YR710]|uniref:TonB-dependent receptor domain-containing protein n=1 Tax=Sphingomonas sp. YR710 TaxID=1882773 RepID=UPI0015A057D0|nr:TonB-dependent receptor [Sphingomonas sp. YR710]